MSTPTQIYTAIQTQLRADASLSYVEDSAVLLGLRESFVQYPAICIEEGKTLQENIDVDTFVDITMRIPIFILIKPLDPDKQLVGDLASVTVGAADILNDLKKALSADPTLGGYAINSYFGEADPLLEQWPTRSQSLVFIVFFRQHRINRT